MPFDDTPDPAITRLLQEWRVGRSDALERLVPLVYRELHGLAARHLVRERAAHTLQPTALVHEAYLRLSKTALPDWQDRAHFFAVAAKVMRRILVDHARQRGRIKRGSAAPVVPLDDVDPAGGAAIDPVDALALDGALSRLEDQDAQQAQVVELRFFGGLTVEETAEVMGVSSGTVKRDWVVARAWLYRELAGNSPPA
jgi:RNA polymerase sigma factor (TIGR02999 family)